jgi:cyclopropane fatty-acyl-phospholipid synthase-like methyltransferase
MRYYLLTSDDYTEAYRRLMKMRVARHGAGSAVGGTSLGIGRLQFEFMTENGLSPDSTLLDLGCGSLRGGQYYIPYLAAGNYVGMDISREAIDAGIEMVGQEALDAASAEFIVNDDLRFEEVDREFDRIIAQSVLTHLPEAPIRELFEHLPTVLSDDGVFFATFFDETRKSTTKDYCYAPRRLTELAAEYGLQAVTLAPEEYPHPRGQRMLNITHM